MADALYTLTLRMTQNITKAINEDEKIMMETAALFISICYAPWFLKSYMVNKAPSNDPSAVKSSFHIRDHYPRLRQDLLASIQRHCWYLSEHLVFLALANDYIELEPVLRIRIRDPGLGTFLTPGSGIRDGRKSVSGSGIRDEQPGSCFLELRNHFFCFFEG
jgi:hypothetical protein